MAAVGARRAVAGGGRGSCPQQCLGGLHQLLPISPVTSGLPLALSGTSLGGSAAGSASEWPAGLYSHFITLSQSLDYISMARSRLQRAMHARPASVAALQTERSLGAHRRVYQAFTGASGLTAAGPSKRAILRPAARNVLGSPPACHWKAASRLLNYR